MNNSLARNKLSCTIDTRRPEGRELLMRLAERSDVFIDNFKAAGLGPHGHRRRSSCGAESAADRRADARRPGSSGDWSGYTGFGAQFDGLTGMLWFCGHSGLRSRDQSGDHLHGRGLRARCRLRHRRRACATGPAPVAASSSNSTRARTSSTTSGTSSSTASWGWSRGGGATVTRGMRHRACTAATARTSGWRSRSVTTRRGALWPLPSDGRTSGAILASPTSPGARPTTTSWTPLIGAWAAEQSALDAFHLLQRAGVAAGPLPRATSMFAEDPHLRRPTVAATPPEPRRRHPPAPRSAVSRRAPGLETRLARARRGQRVRLQGDPRASRTRSSIAIGTTGSWPRTTSTPRVSRTEAGQRRRAYVLGRTVPQNAFPLCGYATYFLFTNCT